MKWIDIWGDREFQAVSEYIMGVAKRYGISLCHTVTAISLEKQRQAP